MPSPLPTQRDNIIPLSRLGAGVGSEVQRPLATVVVGGLVSSMLRMLLIVQALVAWGRA